jgi:Fic family protein
VDPGAIDRALAADYSDDPRCRRLQLEARAHIEVQRMIDSGAGFPKPPATRAYIEWIHREFCMRLPPSSLVAEGADTGERLPMVPGELRKGKVTGGHNAPPVEVLPDCMVRFELEHDWTRLTKLRQAIAAAAAHQRLLWIHPFPDANARVAQLMSHAMLLDVGVSSTLWSISRGLAENSGEYKHLLTEAEVACRADLDTRRAASQRQVLEFCRFFLTSCIGQVRYMRNLLRPPDVQRRIELYVRDEESANRLPRRSFSILREAFLRRTGAWLRSKSD